MFLLFIFQIIYCQQQCDVEQLCKNMSLYDATLHFTLHSHLEPFDSRTLQQYFSGIYSDKHNKYICVECLYTQLFEYMQKYNDFTYIVSEICYFKLFYEKQNQTIQLFIQNVIQQRRLEFVNGGWVQNDQACTNYQDIILQLRLGHQWLYDNFNYTVQTAWNIDSYGHSLTQNVINYLFNMKQQIIERVDVNDVIQRVKKGRLEFIYKIKPYNYEILTHLRFRRHTSFNLKYTDQCIQVYNQLKEFEQLLYYQKQGGLGNALFHYSGDVFQYLNETNIESQQLIFQFYEQFSCRHLQINWSTTQQFFENLRNNSNFTYKTTDFIPHFEDQSYYNAFYTTNPLLKRTLRSYSQQLQAFNLYVIQNKMDISLQQLSELIALAQHHDGITGTAKYAVLDDLVNNIQLVTDQVKQKINYYQHNPLIGQLKHALKQSKIVLDCTNNNKCILDYFIKNRRQKSVIILIYNPQHSQDKIFEIEVPSKQVLLLNQDLQRIAKQEIKVINETIILAFQTYLSGYSEQQYVLTFECGECAPINEFVLHIDLSEQIKQLERQFSLGEPIESQSFNDKIQDVSIEIQRQGIDFEFIFTFENNTFSIKFNYYPNTKSEKQKQAGKAVLMSDYSNGGLICEFEKLYKLKFDSQFQEIILQCGKIYQVSLLFNQGVEVRTQMFANTLTMGDYTACFTFYNITEDANFYTDSNGWYSIQRRLNKREDYEPQCTDNDQINCNLYPMTAFAKLESPQHTAVILTDRSQGVFSIQSQTIEILLEHLAGDDGSGEVCGKRFNHQFRHSLIFNPQCLRCKWNEFLVTSDFLRLSNEFFELQKRDITDSSGLRLEFWKSSSGQIGMYAENLNEQENITLNAETIASILRSILEWNRGLHIGFRNQTLRNQNLFDLQLMRQTPFQQFAQQSFLGPQPMEQFMQDYDQITNTGRRPRSRELDMMNLLLIGSMNKGDKRSGLEGIDQFLSPPTQQQPNSLARFGQQMIGSPFDPIIRAQKSAPILPLPQQDSLSQFAQQQGIGPTFGIPPRTAGQQLGMPPMGPSAQFGMPPGQQFGMPPGMQGLPPGMQGMPSGMQGMPSGMPLGMQAMPPGMPLGMPLGMGPQFGMPPGQMGPPPTRPQFNGPPMMPQNNLQNQFIPDFNPSISPPTNQKLLINGQMGVNVQQNMQQAPELQEKPNTRIIDYIQRQNEVLEKLTQNMAQQREQDMKEEKSALVERMKKLEAQNAQDAFYNDMYDEVPPHVRQHQQFKPPPGYQYQPYYQQQNLYQQQFPSMPYPQKTKSKQQTLQMLRMLKQMKLANQNRKNKKKKKLTLEEIINDEGEVDSYTSEESDPEPRVVQKPRILKPRPIPPPPPYDPNEDENKLKKLKQQRGFWNLKRRFHLLSFFIWRYAFLKKSIRKKKDEAIQKGPEIQQKFMEDTHGLYTRVLKNVIDQLVNPKTNLQIVPKPKQKISPNQMKQNILKLKELVKQLFDAVTDNATENDITENMIIYLNSITQEYAYLLDSQHLKFELSRLNYSYHGSVIKMNQNKQYMMLTIAIIVKVLLFRLLSKIHIAIPGIKVTDQLKTNVKTLVSVVYEIFMLFIRGFTAVQPDNTKYIPVENVVKEKKEMYYQVETFDATEDEIAKIEEAKQKANSKDERIDEPLLFPIYNNREMAAFFDTERMYVTTLQQMVEGWCEKVNSLLLNVRGENDNKRKEQVRLQKEQENKIMGIKRDQVNKILKSRVEQYQQLCQDIEDMKDKIAQNIDKANQAKQEYEQMQQQRNERQMQQYGRGALPNGRQF